MHNVEVRLDRSSFPWHVQQRGARSATAKIRRWTAAGPASTVIEGRSSDSLRLKTARDVVSHTTRAAIPSRFMIHQTPTLRQPDTSQYAGAVQALEQGGSPAYRQALQLVAGRMPLYRPV